MSITYSLLLILSIVAVRRVNAFHNIANSSETVKIRQRVDSSINWFLRHTPLFDLTKIDNISEICRRDFETFLDGIENLELWALKSEIKLQYIWEEKSESGKVASRNMFVVLFLYFPSFFSARCNRQDTKRNFQWQCESVWWFWSMSKHHDESITRKVLHCLSPAAIEKWHNARSPPISSVVRVFQEQL